MRAGSAFRRCTSDRCRARVAASARACPKCGGHSLSWAFVIDLALPGSRRKQRFGSGFATKAAAVEAMNRLQAAVVDGTHVERSRRTLGAYLEDWLGARNDIRANTARDYSVSIHNHIGPRLGDVPLQAVDRLRIAEVFTNLVSNALRHTPRGGSITLDAVGDEHRVEFSVTDTGSGIPADQLPTVFDRFAKAPGSRGVGLGLAIAKSLVVAHGGEIGVASPRTGGTRVYFALPSTPA